jgi:hypothetical protein
MSIYRAPRFGFWICVANLASSKRTVPFRQDPDFVDRGDQLSRLDQQCSQPAGRAALVGLGGVGKSQLAIEYTYRIREQSPETGAFWVHASNAARFEQGYRDITNVVKIDGRSDAKANIFKLVHDWLRDESNGNWLLILASSVSLKHGGAFWISVHNSNHL